MVTLYIYDVFAKDKKEFNKIKRKFYYRLNKIKRKADISLLSKSAILCDKEEIIDNFFKEFEGKVICFKIKVENIEKLI